MNELLLLVLLSAAVVGVFYWRWHRRTTWRRRPLLKGDLAGWETEKGRIWRVGDWRRVRVGAGPDADQGKDRGIKQALFEDIMKSDEKNTGEEKYQILCRAIEEAGIPSLRRWILAQEKANGALRDAIRAGDTEAMKQALAHGAKVEWPDCDGSYPVAECVSAPGDGADIGTIKLLIAAGAPIHQVHESGEENRLIHDAAGSGKIGMVQFLLSMGEAVDATDCDGCQAIHAAAWGGQRAMVDFLLGVGAKATIPKGRLSLHYAAAFGDMEAAGRLLAEGDLVSQEDCEEGSLPANSGRLPIHFAAMHGRLEMARFLVEAGAKLDAHCMWGGTPADMAREKGHVEVAEYLEGEGRNKKSPTKRG